MAATQLKEKKNEAKRLIESLKPQIAEILPETASNEDRMCKVAYMAIAKSEQLLECSQASIAAAVLQACELGLELNGPMGQAYLIPFKGEAVLCPGYLGLVTLAYRSGAVKDVSMEVVGANDLFDVDLGTSRRVIHKPKLGDRGKPIAVYCTVVLQDDYHHFAVMSIDEAMDHGKKYAKAFGSAKSIWQTDPIAACLKTVVRKALKLCPKAVENELLVRAATIQENVMEGRYKSRFEAIEAEMEAPQGELGKLAAARASVPATNIDLEYADADAETGELPMEAE